MSDLYEDFVPTFIQIAEAQLGLIDKAEAFCAANSVAPEALLEDRLAPDMLPLKFQLAQVTRHSAGAIARMTGGREPRSGGETFAAIREELSATVSYLNGVKPDDLSDAADKPVVMKTPGPVLHFKSGHDYITGFAQPNFMFHAATVYAILRKAGVTIGKRDFMGNVKVTRSEA